MKVKHVLLGGIVLFLTALVLAQPTITVSPTTVAAGGIVTISISGTDAESCAIEIIDPNNNKPFVDEITLSAGAGSVTWTVPSTAALGSYTIYVGCSLSGTATATLTVTAPVGGEARKDFTPLLLAILAGITIIAASLVIRKSIS